MALGQTQGKPAPKANRMPPTVTTFAVAFDLPAAPAGQLTMLEPDRR